MAKPRLLLSLAVRHDKRTDEALSATAVRESNSTGTTELGESSEVLPSASMFRAVTCISGTVPSQAKEPLALACVAPK